MGASPTAGSITVTISGNSLPVVASATRISGADTSGANGSGAIEAVATEAGPPVTDDRNMKVEITTLSNNARAYAAGTHRLATFTVPPGESAISVNNVAGDSGDKTTLSTWYEAAPTPGTVTLGADNDLNSDRDWAVVAVSLRPAGSAGQALSQSETVTASITSGASITLPAWTPAANDLILVAVALRDETRPVAVSGNGLTFVEVANLDNAQNQTGVNLFRAMGAAPVSGPITVTLTGNSLPAIASATRIAGADTSGTNGSGAVEAVATNAGPPATDDDDMKIAITTLTPNAWAYAAGTHRLASFGLPSGQIAIATNNFAGSSGDTTTLSTWYQPAAAPATVTLGADNDLNSVRDWAVVAVSIKPTTGAANAPPSVAITSPVSGESFQFPVTPILVSADAQGADGTVAQVEFFANGVLIGGATASPFTIQWSNVAAGDYTLTARATDDAGAQTTSAAVNISVRVPQIFYMHTDHLNTPRLIANGASQTVWTWANDDPFGANVPNENPSGLGIFTCNLRLPGQYFDKETGLHYSYYRDYDPAIGRFPQFDPIGLRGGINGYVYVENNPLSFIDPFGLQASDVFGGEQPRSPVVGWPNVSTQAQQSLAGQLQRLWNNIFSQSSSNDELERCYQDCEAQRKRDQDDCEWWWKMRGRNVDDYRRCQRAADERLLKCYENCRNTCKQK